MNPIMSKIKVEDDRWSDVEVGLAYGDYENNMQRLKGAQDIELEVRKSVNEVLELIAGGTGFDDAVTIVRYERESWLGRVPWVEIKRRVREQLNSTDES